MQLNQLRDSNSTPNLCIVSPPRSGSSYAMKNLQTVESSLLEETLFPKLGISRSSSAFNPSGYMEGVGLNLLFDQMIRLRRGARASFLNNALSDPLSERPSFEYDLDERVELPNGFNSNVIHYTGQSWDVWGLTRMSPGGKWHKAYTRAGVRYRGDVEVKWQRLVQILSEERSIVLKDPRALYLAEDFPASTKILIILRDPSELIKSMRLHYGPRMFTDKVFEGFDWASNHFNYRVQPQDFSDYFDEVLRLVTRLQETFETLIVKTENLSDKKTLKRVKSFAGQK